MLNILGQATYDNLTDGTSYMVDCVKEDVRKFGISREDAQFRDQ